MRESTPFPFMKCNNIEEFNRNQREYERYSHGCLCACARTAIWSMLIATLPGLCNIIGTILLCAYFYLTDNTADFSEKIATLTPAMLYMPYVEMLELLGFLKEAL